MNLRQAAEVTDRRRAPSKPKRKSDSLMAVGSGESVAPEPRILDPLKYAQSIAEAAYYIAERRGFGVGRELDDWLQAEAEIARLT
jgi:hypothetical protein